MKICLKGEWFELTLTPISVATKLRKKKVINGINDNEVINNIADFFHEQDLFGKKITKGDYINFYIKYGYENRLTIKKTTMLFCEFAKKFNYKSHKMNRSGVRYLIIEI